MGFYVELRKVPARDGVSYLEAVPPGVFWVLYGFLGFALTAMGLSAGNLLSDLAHSEDWIDGFLVGAFVIMVPVYLLIGVKLGFLRKRICFSQNELGVSYELGGYAYYTRKWPKSSIINIGLKNQRPKPNLAPLHHDDPHYYVRGHWRVVANLENGKEITLDRQTEKEALHELHQDGAIWLGVTGRQNEWSRD